MDKKIHSEGAGKTGHPSTESIAGWQDYKFGMFIHWGLYALLARGEWVLFNEQMDVDEYRKLMDDFHAESFCAADWARVANDAGMGYMVLTSRHHDGFSLFDSEASVGNFTSMNAACRRDIVREYTTACREARLGVGLYYSPMDWRFPGFFAPKMYRQSAISMKQQCHGQIEELLSNYGKVDILWYDGGTDFWLAHAQDIRHNLDVKYTRDNPLCPGFWDGDHLNEMARRLQPEMMINERIGDMSHADFHVSEGKVGKFNFDVHFTFLGRICLIKKQDIDICQWGHRVGRRLVRRRSRRRWHPVRSIASNAVGGGGGPRGVDRGGRA